MRTTTNDLDIPDQTGTLAVVTDANSGIGFGVSQRLAAAGAMVILAVRNTDKGNQAAQAIRAPPPMHRWWSNSSISPVWRRWKRSPPDC